MHDAMNTTSAPQEVTAIDLVALERRLLLDKIADLEGEVRRVRDDVSFWIERNVAVEGQRDTASAELRTARGIVKDLRDLAVDHGLEGDVDPLKHLRMVLDIGPLMTPGAYRMVYADLVMAASKLSGRSPVWCQRLRASAEHIATLLKLWERQKECRDG